MYSQMHLARPRILVAIVSLGALTAINTCDNTVSLRNDTLQLLRFSHKPVVYQLFYNDKLTHISSVNLWVGGKVTANLILSIVTAILRWHKPIEESTYGIRKVLCCHRAKQRRTRGILWVNEILHRYVKRFRDDLQRQGENRPTLLDLG